MKRERERPGGGTIKEEKEENEHSIKKKKVQSLKKPPPANKIVKSAAPELSCQDVALSLWKLEHPEHCITFLGTNDQSVQELAVGSLSSMPLIDLNVDTMLQPLVRQKRKLPSHLENMLLRVLSRASLSINSNFSKFNQHQIASLENVQNKSLVETVLKGLVQLIMCKELESVLSPELSMVIKKLFFNFSPKVRVAALELGFCILPVSELFVLLNRAINDPDFRVRRIAVRCIILWHANEKLYANMAVITPEHIWNLASIAVEDDFSQVRVEGYRLLWILSSLFPDVMIMSILAKKSLGKEESSTEIRLRIVDAAFTALCAGVNDTNIGVRAEAISLLGRFRGVSLKLLLQSFSKELLLDKKLKLTRSRHKHTTALVIGDFEIDERENVSLTDALAAGAFVHALEDEYEAVRMSAIDSMCELAVHYGDPFAAKAIEFLVDMFNDSIENVRLNAINSLRKVGTNLSLREDSLTIVLSCLEDLSLHIRYSIHLLLSQVQLSNLDCCLATIHALLIDLKKHPYDLPSIFACLKGIGRNHSSFVELLLDDLLKLDKNFIPTEANVEDRYYQGILITICNAAIENNNLINLLPSFVAKHYHYLCEKYPLYFPSSITFKSLNQPLSTENIGSLHLTGSHSINQENIDEFFLSRFKASLHIQSKANQKSLSMDLNRLCRHCPSLTAKAKYYDILQIFLTSIPEVITNDAPRLIPNLVDKINELEHQFLGYSQRSLTKIMLMRFIITLIEILSRDNEVSAEGNRRLQSEFEALLTRIKAQNLGGDPHFSWLLAEDTQIRENTERKVLLSLYAVLRNKLLAVEHLEDNIKPLSVHWIRPSSSYPGLHRVMSFHSRIPHQVHIEVVIDNIQSLQNIWIACSFPDETIQYFPINPEDSQCLRMSKHKINCHIEILPWMCKSWTGAGSVTIRLAKKLEQTDNMYIDVGHSIQYMIHPTELKKKK